MKLLIKKFLSVVITLCMMVGMLPGAASAMTGSQTEPQVSYTVGEAYKYTSGDTGITAVQYGDTALNSTAVYSMTDNVLTMGTTQGTTSTSTNLKLIYVPVEATVAVPANTELYIKHNIEAEAVRIVEDADATVTATSAVYYLGETDASSDLTFYPAYSGNVREGADPLELAFATQAQSDLKQTAFSINTNKVISYNNDTDQEKEFTSYFGVMIVIQKASSVKNTMTAEVTFTAEHSHNYGTTGVCACGNVYVDERAFPDANFLACVETLEGADDLVLTPDELAAIEEITVDSKSIASLKGIEHFTAITSLSCEFNSLTELDLNQNTALKALYCKYNDLADLDLSKNTALEILSCEYNEFTSLDVSNNTALKELSCYGNNLTSLDVRSNTALEQLYFYLNNLTSIDLSNNIALTNLACYGNNLTSLDVSNNTELESLLCNTNKLVSLDLSNNTKIGSFNGRQQTPAIEIDSATMTFDMSTLDSSFDSSKVSELTEGCSFEGSVLTVGTGVTSVAYKYAAGKGDYALEVTLAVNGAETKHTHNDITFTEWTATDSLPTVSGNYYLANNVTLASDWTVPSENVSLCLNGHKIIGTESDLSVINIEGTVFNLYDCSDGEGMICASEDYVYGIYICGSEATFNMYGGIIKGFFNYGVVNWSGTFNMYGGSVTGNIGDAGVLNYSGAFNMYGGAITDNEVNYGGVYNDGSVTLSGNISITGNKLSVWDSEAGDYVLGDDRNLVLNSGCLITIGEAGLAEDVKIGITVVNGGTWETEGYVTGENDSDITAYFKSDSDKYMISNLGNNVVAFVKKPPEPTYVSVPGGWEGKGTLSSPWIIDTAKDLQDMAACINGNVYTEVGGIAYNTAHYKLGADIDLSGIADWTPIGCYDFDYEMALSFKGSFDGAGYTIFNMTIDRGDEEYEYRGLFGCIEKGAVVKNVTLSDVSMVVNWYSGGIAYGSNGIIENCHVISGTIKGTSYIGGIVGTLGEGGIVRNCSNGATVTYPEDAYSSQDFGGIVGYSYSGIIENCYNRGSIIGKGREAGIVAYSAGETVTRNCYNIGSITDNRSGSIAGYIDNSSRLKNEIYNCYYLSTDGVGRVYGHNNAGTITNCSAFDSAEDTVSYNGGTPEVLLAEALNSYAKDNGSSEYLLWKVSEDVNDGYPVFGNPHIHDGITFTEWTATDSLPTESGNYCLANNVTLSDEWTVPTGETSICLNGHTINVGEYRIDIGGSADTLNIYNCGETTGNITGADGSSTSNNTLMDIAYGSGVLRINGNVKLSGKSYAVSTANGDIYLSGAPVVEGTTAGIYIQGFMTPLIDATSYTGDNMSVYMSDAVADKFISKEMAVVTNYDNTKTGKFTFANENYLLKASEGNLILKAVTHDHTDGTIFKHLTAASENLESGNYYLTENITATGNITIPSDAEVTLCLNGKTLDLGEHCIDNYGILTICDCTENGKITTVYYQAVINSVTGTLYITGGTIENTYATQEYRSVVQNDGTLYMSGGTLTMGETSYGSLYNTNGSECHISGGRIASGNYAIYGYGDGTIYLSGSPEISGGGIYGYDIFSYDWEDVYPKLYATSSVESTSAPYTGDELIVYNSGAESGFVAVYNCTDIDKFGYAYDYGLTPKDGNLVLAEALFAVGDVRILETDGAIDDVFGDGGTVSYTPATATSDAIFRLNGATFEGDIFPLGYGASYIVEFDGINTIGGLTNHYDPSTLVRGLDEDAELNMVCIYTDGGGDLTIEGEGKINLSGGEEFSIYVGDLVISGCEITAHGSGGEYYGFAVWAESITINEGMKSLYATVSGNEDFPVVTESFTVNNGTFNLLGSQEMNATDNLSEIVFNPTYSEWDGTMVMANEQTTPAMTVSITSHVHTWSTAWSSDGTAHWHECTASGCDITENTKKDGYETHSEPDDDNDCTTDIKCAACGYVFAEGNASHSFTTTASTTEASAETCIANKFMYAKCDNCDAVSDSVKVEVANTILSHNYTYSKTSGNVIAESCDKGCGHIATATLTAPTQNLVYNGSSHNADVSYDAGWAGGALAITYTKGGSSTADTIFAGSYEAGVTIGGASASVNYTIEKQTVTEPTIDSKTYTEETLVADVSDTALYTVSQNNGGLNVGSYDVVLTLTDSNNYKWSSTDDAAVTLEFTIAKAVNEFTTLPAISGWTYGETPSVPAGEAAFGEVVFKYYDSGKNELGVTAPVNAGNYYIKAFVVAGTPLTRTATDNYDALSSDFIAFTIAKAQVQKPAEIGTTFTYNGAEQTYAIAESSLYTVTDNKRTNAGEYYVGVTLNDTDNYEWNDGETGQLTYLFSIDPLDISGAEITLGDTLTYNGSEQTQTVASAMIDSLPVTFDVSGNTGTAVADYTLTITGNGNFAGTENKGWSIAKALPVIETNPTASRVRKNNALSTSTLTGGVAKGVGDSELTGAFAWKDGAEMLDTKGTVQKTVVFTPNDTNYSAVEFDVDVEVYTISGGGGTIRYTIKFETNGESTMSAKTVLTNTVLDEPAEPTRDGFTFGGWYTDEELTEEYDFDSKVTKSFTLYAKWIENEKEPDENDDTNTKKWNPFIDVSENNWFYTAVQDAYLAELITGTSENTFSPNGNITRGMFVTILWRAEGKPEETQKATFKDVEKGLYYEKAVDWGSKNGIILGFSEFEYAPDKEITREQMAAILFRYATFKGIDTMTLAENLGHFKDNGSVSEYAVSALNWAVGTDIISGKGNGVLDPLKNATRAEATAMLIRFIEKNMK